MKLKALPLLAALGALPLAPANARAQEGGLLSPDTGMMAWTLIVFAIVLFVLMKFAYPYILGAVEAREQRIRELLAAAERDREESQHLLDEQRRQHEELRAQAQEMFAEAKASGERTREELLSQARREADEILTRARRDIEAQTERALDAVRRDAVEVALAAAAKLVRRNLDDEQNRELVREFLGQLEQRPSSAAAGV